jgi:hypothetical protein
MFSSFYAFSTFFIAVVVLNLSLIVFLGGKNLSSKLFALSAFFNFLWLASVGFGYLFTDPALNAFAGRGTTFAGLCTIWVLYFFSLSYPENDIKFWGVVRKIIVLGIVGIFFLVYIKDILSLFGEPFNSFIKEQTLVVDSFTTKNGYSGWRFGFLWTFWTMLFYGFGFSFVAMLYQKFVSQTDELLRKQTLFMLVSMAVAMPPVCVFNVLLPTYGIFGFYWWGALSSVAWVSVVGYSIIKQGQMKVLTVRSELLVVAMILLMFVGFFAV